MQLGRVSNDSRVPVTDDELHDQFENLDKYTFLGSGLGLLFYAAWPLYQVFLPRPYDPVGQAGPDKVG